LIVHNEDGTESEHTVKSEGSTIGRSKECDIRLEGPGLSRLHAVVESVDGKLVIRDQASNNGTYVNGERVETAELAEGDEIKIGGIAIAVAADGGASAAERASRRRARGGEGEDAEERRSSRPKRKILGGVSLSGRQQTMVKIVCAVIMFVCIIGILWLLEHRSHRQPPVSIVREIHVNLMDEPNKLWEDAKALFKQAVIAEEAGKTQEAFERVDEANSKMDGALEKLNALANKHRNADGSMQTGYTWIDKLVTDINMQAKAIRDLHFRMEMQLLRDKR